MPDTRNAFKFESVGAQTVGANKDRWTAPFSGEIINAFVEVGTAPTVTDLIFDINKNGVSIYTTQANRPRVVAGATSSTAEQRPDETVRKFAAGDVLSLDVDQIGTVAGSDVDVTVQYVTA